MSEMVRSFEGLTAEQRVHAGGKGGALARLYQAGYPVPGGFVILSHAFDGDRLRPGAWDQIEAYLGRMREDSPRIAFAVRSSALSEDSAQASFAGEFETVLDVHTDAMVREAIRRVRQSRHSERVRAYSEAKGIDAVHDVAVVVQRLVRADISGVLFTADPVTGSHSSMLGNFVFGFGEELVSGEAEAYTFRLARPRFRYEGPPELRRFALKLYRLAVRLERDLGSPQDIEWAIDDGRLSLLQSRPITTLQAREPAGAEWNDTLTGDYLWTNQMTGEVFPDVMTPSSWSVWKVLFDRLSTEIHSIGNIGGRPYVNFSVLYSVIMKLTRSAEKARDMLESAGGYVSVPEGVEIPMVSLSTRSLLLKVLPRELRAEVRKRRLLRKSETYLAGVRERCQDLHQQIRRTAEGAALASLWRDEVRPLFVDVFTLQDATNERAVMLFGALKRELTALLGEDDTNRLLSTLGGEGGYLASLGPLAELSRVARGEMPREVYGARYGHRGPHENEISMPRPAEEPGWLDKQMEELERSGVDVGALLERRRAESEAARRRFEERYPGKTKSVGRKIDLVAARSRLREATRSELTRVAGVIRDLFLRSGELTGLDDDVFFLTCDELMDVLSGDDSSTAQIPARREAHARYSALPPYPSFIRGRFDPLQWAQDPDRRSDFYDASAPVQTPESSAVRGNAGSAGRVQGVVRRIDHPEDGDELLKGEVLVTVTTNVGWTPLFPRAAAIVTDVGAQLSHAAIVARELGIPAVVGCGNATMRLKTGDRVLVDGGRGVVEILEVADAKRSRGDADSENE